MNSNLQGSLTAGGVILAVLVFFYGVRNYLDSSVKPSKSSELNNNQNGLSEEVQGSATATANYSVGEAANEVSYVSSILNSSSGGSKRKNQSKNKRKKQSKNKRKKQSKNKRKKQSKKGGK